MQKYNNLLCTFVVRYICVLVCYIGSQTPKKANYTRDHSLYVVPVRIGAVRQTEKFQSSSEAETLHKKYVNPRSALPHVPHQTLVRGGHNHTYVQRSGRKKRMKRIINRRPRELKQKRTNKQLGLNSYPSLVQRVQMPNYDG